MNTCYYQITRYSYTPKKKVLTLEERKAKFKKLIWEEIGKTFAVYSKEMLEDFVGHWIVTGKLYRVIW